MINCLGFEPFNKFREDSSWSRSDLLVAIEWVVHLSYMFISGLSFRCFTATCTPAASFAISRDLVCACVRRPGI